MADEYENDYAEQHAPSAGQQDAKPVPVLPWMQVPITFDASTAVPLDHVLGLHPSIKQALRQGPGYTSLFPVQAAVWRELAGGMSTAHDLCICAPTGSGKTLAYTLPALQGLLASHSYSHTTSPQVHLLQALVVLPTRDLAVQVYDLFRSLAPICGLIAGLAAAQSPLAAEAAVLVGPPGSRHQGVDILVATPGRLMAHLRSTAGMTLQHLRFLVVDETDRLLRQSYQEWLPHVMHCIASSSAEAAAAPGSIKGRRVVKLVVSATLTRDPAKLERLRLHCPRYISMSAVDHRYKLPASLQEFKLVAQAGSKPLLLLALLHEMAGQPTLVFASSLEATHKVALLLAATAADPQQVVEFSSYVGSSQRAANLARFRSGAATVLVASDAMTRGMDVEDVQNVINYDAPVYVKTYVHRAGRTARAGRAGRVFTLLREEDMRHFKQMLRKVDNRFVKDFRLQAGSLEAVRPRVEPALVQVQQLLEAEAEAQQAGAKGKRKQQQQQQQQQQEGEEQQEEQEQHGMKKQKQ